MYLILFCIANFAQGLSTKLEIKSKRILMRKYSNYLYKRLKKVKKVDCQVKRTAAAIHEV